MKRETRDPKKRQGKFDFGSVGPLDPYAGTPLSYEDYANYSDFLMEGEDLTLAGMVAKYYKGLLEGMNVI